MPSSPSLACLPSKFCGRQIDMYPTQFAANPLTSFLGYKIVQQCKGFSLIITIKRRKRWRLYLSNWQHPHAGISSHSSRLFTMPTLGRTVIALWPTQNGRMEKTLTGEALGIVETDTKIPRSLERRLAHANDIHRTLSWCAL